MDKPIDIAAEMTREQNRLFLDYIYREAKSRGYSPAIAARIARLGLRRIKGEK